MKKSKLPFLFLLLPTLFSCGNVNLMTYKEFLSFKDDLSYDFSNITTYTFNSNTQIKGEDDNSPIVKTSERLVYDLSDDLNNFYVGYDNKTDFIYSGGSSVIPSVYQGLETKITNDDKINVFFGENFSEIKTFDYIVESKLFIKKNIDFNSYFISVKDFESIIKNDKKIVFYEKNDSVTIQYNNFNLNGYYIGGDVEFYNNGLLKSLNLEVWTPIGSGDEEVYNITNYDIETEYNKDIIKLYLVN